MRIPAFVALLSLLALPAMAQAPAAPAAPTPGPAATAPTAPAPAEAPAAAKLDLAAFVKEPGYQAEIIKVARAQMKQAPTGCPNPSFTPTGDVHVLEPVRFVGSQPTGGAWYERIDTTGCGPLRALNVLTIAHADTLPQFVAIMPGDTHADPVMQKNALEYAQAIAVRAAPPGCKQLAFVDTKFDGYSGLPNPEVQDGRDGRAWREVWTLAACGALYDVNLVFTPNAKGTALSGENPVKHS